jgi:hypothetical protein
MQCSLDETKGLEEAIHLSSNPDLYNHNHIIDIAASDHLKVTLSVATIKNRHRESTVATEHSIAQITCFDEYNQMLWETILEGSNETYYGPEIAIYNDLIYVTGYTRSPDFPVKNAFQETLNGQCDAFVSCFDLIGNLEWSTYLGGTVNTRAQSCMFYQDHLYIAGWTSSPDFPVKNAMQDVFQTKRLKNDFIEDPMTNAFIVRLTPFGELETSTFMDYQGHSLRQYVDHPSCMLSAMDNGNVLLAIYQVAGSGESKLIKARYDVQESNTLFYILTDDCRIISHHYLF